MQISEILAADSILCGQTLTSKKTALEELSKLLANTDPSLGYIEVFDCLLAREKLGSTGLGNGIAIPHGRLKGGKKTIAAFIQLQYGIDFDAVDGAPVDLLFALLVPEDSTEEHLQTLSHLAEMFSNSATLEQLRLGSSAKEMYEILTR
ncbi:MAG: PTS system nitrogen regulatory IIA component [Gammaproteobacteria bacterium]|jgi:PTS system nitrogen regulatory IIA component